MRFPLLQRLPKQSLARRLILQTTLLVVLVAVALVAVSGFAGFQILEQELDNKLFETTRRTHIKPQNSLQVMENVFDCSRSGDQLIRLEFVGDQFYMTTCPVVLSEKARNQLQSLIADSVPVTMELDGIGTYRVLAVAGIATFFDGSSALAKTVVALPYSEVSGPMARESIVSIILSIVAIAGAYLGTQRIVRKSLLPLQKLTDTATYISTLPLASGEGVVGVRFNDSEAESESEVGRVGQAFNHMLDNVEGALVARNASETKVRQFVADASHELRNPLAAIRGYAELTRRGGEDLPKDTAFALERIEAESQRMTALVNDLLLLARLDASPTAESVPTDLTDIVLNAVSDAQAAGPDHDWVIDLPNETIIVPGNKDQLHQVTTNLLANARVHTPAGTKVTTTLRRDGDAILLIVADNGPGVPQEAKQTVFERFSRADSSRIRRAGSQSTGLGLAIVAATVEAHGGKVFLDSVPGNTVFTVKLPLAPALPVAGSSVR